MGKYDLLDRPFLEARIGAINNFSMLGEERQQDIRTRASRLPREMDYYSSDPCLFISNIFTRPHPPDPDNENQAL